MAGSDQDKQAGGKRERVVPGIMRGKSRVSKVVGNVGLSSRRNRFEQRSSSSPARQSSRSSSAARGSRGGAKKGSSAKRPPSRTASPDGTADSRVIARTRNAWNNLPPHHQQRILSLILLGLAILLFASLTVLRSSPLLNFFSGAFFVLFGWSAYLLALGLIAFAIAHLIESIRNERLIRWPFVIGLILLWLILLAESHLLLGGTTGGVIGELLARPFLGWPPAIGHIVLIGLFGIITILTFRITLGHVLYTWHAITHLFSFGRNRAANASRSPSPFLGQRPQYSRYGTGLPPSSGGVPGSADEDEDAIDFEADFDADDDPLNDINLHKEQVGAASRASRSVQPLDIEEHKNAVQGARQPVLPFNQAARAPEGNLPAMEPLAPNPHKANQPKAVPPGAGAPTALPAVASSWKLPDISLLNNPEDVKLHMLGDDTAALAKIIYDTLRSFRVEAEVRPEDISIGPTVIRFGIRPTGKPATKPDEKGKPVPIKDAGGNIVYEQRTRVSRIMALQSDLALVLEAKSIRMEAPVPGRPYVGVEIPNKNSRLVTLREVLESKEYQSARAKSKLAIALGKDVAGSVRVGDLARMPHLLIAGATGAGKSVSLNAIIASILMQATPDDVRLVLIDPKMVELNMYMGIPHLLAPVVTEVEKVIPLLKIAINEMEKRYRVFSKLGVRNLDGYRKLRAERIAHGDTSLENLPAIVIIIDELADLMMAAPEEIEGMICRLAQLARATGIHLVIATQRPSVDVITGLIKANIPTRISFMVSSAVDSRTIIDMGGAERLLGRGDMLYLPADAGRPERIQGAYVADEEAERLIAYWRQQALAHASTAGGSQSGPGAQQQAVVPGWEIKDLPSDEFELDDDLLEQAEEVVREYGRASISLLQRRLRIGYSRAARLIDLLEEHGIIGHFEPGGRAREVLENGGANNGGEGRTMADEVADIMAEEKAREEFLKKQGQGTES